MAGKIMILSVPESDGDVFDRIISVLQPLGISEVSEITPKSSIQIGELHIDSSGHSIKKGKKEINLTNTEFQMLYFLAMHKGMAMSKEQIYEYVWNGEYIFDDSNITSHIRRLRVKIEDDPANPQYIQTVRGVGYKMAKLDNDNW
uniref:winged helix-turn-helix domain-containing protein n=1 Tax=Roseburia hominis TaxID=301301 RepID=UPI001F47DA60